LRVFGIVVAIEVTGRTVESHELFVLGRWRQAARRIGNGGECTAVPVGKLETDNRVHHDRVFVVFVFFGMQKRRRESKDSRNKGTGLVGMSVAADDDAFDGCWHVRIFSTLSSWYHHVIIE